MQSELERLLKRKRRVPTWTTGVLLFFGVVTFLGGWYGELLSPSAGGYHVVMSPAVWLIWAAYCFIGYYRLRQSRVNVELAKAIRGIQERLDQGAMQEDV